jgi:hypothetical protein
MTASIDALKSRHLLNHWLSNSPNSFNGLRWTVEIGQIGEPTVLGAREGRRLVMSYRLDVSKSQQSYLLKHFFTSRQSLILMSPAANLYP